MAIKAAKDRRVSVFVFFPDNKNVRECPLHNLLTSSSQRDYSTSRNRKPFSENAWITKFNRLVAVLISNVCMLSCYLIQDSRLLCIVVIVHAFCNPCVCVI